VPHKQQSFSGLGEMILNTDTSQMKQQVVEQDLVFKPTVNATEVEINREVEKLVLD